MRDVINYYQNNINNSKILKKIGLTSEKYLLVSLHREENVDNKTKLKNIFNQLNTIYKKNKFDIIFSTHPRTQAKIKKFKLSNNNFKFMKPFGFFDYCKLQKNSFCAISDSGTIFEESAILNFPAITIRASHERPEGIEGGAVVICSELKQDINNSISISRKLLENSDNIIQDYNKTNIAPKVVKVIESYISIINKKIWFKNS